jgi:hypothetical protein
VKLASFLFLCLLLRAHALDESNNPLGRPLSMFRDGPQAWLGYALFAALLLVGLLYTAALVRRRREGEAAISGLAVLLLLIVAATPSAGAFHGLCSFLLLLLLFGHYAWLLYRLGGPWVFAHLAVPVSLMLGTQFHSYGLWQKGLVLYFLTAVVVHDHVLKREAAGGGRRSARTRIPGSGQPGSRRKVYRLEPGRAWKRRHARGSAWASSLASDP